MTILGLRGEDMRTFKVNMELVISNADYTDLLNDLDGWDLENEIRSWLEDLDFKFVKLNVDEERE